MRIIGEKIKIKPSSTDDEFKKNTLEKSNYFGYIIVDDERNHPGSVRVILEEAYNECLRNNINPVDNFCLWVIEDERIIHIVEEIS